MLTIFMKTTILYVLIVFGLRMMGKRQLGELQPSEFVATILISNIATLPIEDVDIPLLAGILPIVTLVCFEVVMSAISLKSMKARKFFSGSPRMVVQDGNIDQGALRDLRYSIDDLMEQLRQNSIFDISEVAFAVVETTGKLSVYQKFGARPVTGDTLSLSPQGQSNAPPVVMISDGVFIEQALSYCNLRREWLDKVLKEEGVGVHDVFLLTCDRAATYHLVRKEKKEKKKGGGQ